MKYVCLIASLILTIIIATGVYSISGEDALEICKKKMTNTKTIKGMITLFYKTGESYTGNFKYMSPGKIFIKFTSPGGKIIASNGKKLWVYDSSSNVCGVQDLEKDSQGGIIRFLRSYKTIFFSMSKSGYTIKLENSQRKYPHITLITDSTFLLKEAIFENTRREEEGFSISLSGLRFNEKVVPGIFDFNVPATTLVAKNPLNIK